jgi:hypothetical protein
LPAGRSFGLDFAPVRPNCTPRAFGTSLFFAGTCPSDPSPRTKDSYLLALAVGEQRKDK